MRQTWHLEREQFSKILLKSLFNYSCKIIFFHTIFVIQLNNCFFNYQILNICNICLVSRKGLVQEIIHFYCLQEDILPLNLESAPTHW